MVKANSNIESKKESKDFQTQQKLPQSDTAYKDAYAVTVFHESQYNPDDLIGRKGFKIYRKIMLDEQVKAVVRFKRDAITARDYYFAIDGDAISEDEKSRRIAVMESIVDKMQGSFSDALNGIMSAMYNGFSMTEKTFKPVEVDGSTYWGIKSLRTKPFDTFYFHTDGFGNLKALKQKVSGKEIKLDHGKFIHYVNNPDIDEWYGQSELREAYRAWFSKDKIIKIQSIFLERSASGFMWVQPPMDRKIIEGSAEHTQLMKVMRTLSAGSSVLMPSGFDLKVEYPKQDPGFDKAITYHDLAIAKALLVPNLMGLSHQGSVGSYSQAETQLEAFLWTLDSDKKRLEEVLNEQLFRPLGMVNFADEHVPQIRIKPLSKSQLYKLAEVWSQMVTGGAVKASEADEQHLRDILGFPERSQDEEGDATASLEAHQMTALMDIVKAVGAGSMTKATGVEIIVATLPLTREQAETVLADVEEGSNPPPATPGSPQGGDGGGDPSDPTGEDGETPQAPTGEPPEPQDETVRGQGLVSVSAFTKAMKRVDFAVIQRKSETLEAEQATILANRVEQMLDEVKTTFAGETMGSDDLDAIKRFDFSNDLKKSFRKDVRGMLREGWKIGERHAKDEIDKAKGENFSIAFKREKLEFISADFFDIKSFQVTGSFTADLLAKVKNILLNGAKGGKATSEVVREIIEFAVSDGVVSREYAEEELGQLLGAEANPIARLNNIVRTNTFESINEARFAYFTDPQTEDFVEALEYSAILDSRTTQICQHLDGKIYAKDSPEWESYRPPNHFQCRSLLIPVTQVDTWTESEPPTVQPQKGFK